MGDEARSGSAGNIDREDEVKPKDIQTQTQSVPGAMATFSIPAGSCAANGSGAQAEGDRLSAHGTQSSCRWPVRATPTLPLRAPLMPNDASEESVPDHVQ